MLNKEDLSSHLSTLYELSQVYLDWVKSNREPATYTHHLGYLKLCISELGRTLKIGALKPHHLTKWLQSNPQWGSTTQNDAITIVQRMLNWGVEQGYLFRSPIPKIKKPKRDRCEVFYTEIAWKKFDDLDDINRLCGWMMTIARLEALKYRRSLARSPLVFSDKLVEQLADSSGNILASYANRHQTLEGCLRKLDQAKRELIPKVHQPGVTIRGYAQQIARPEQAIYKSIHRLRQKLLTCVKQALADQGLS